MKIYKYLLLSILIPGLLVSCKKEEEDIWSESASVRITKAQNELISNLTSSEQGWVFNYYPNPEKYGAFNYLISFKADGTCDMRGDMFWGNDVVTSKYSTNATQGVCLCFDTYGLLTKLADPSLNVIGNGWDGEQEFVYLRTSENGDTLHFRGKKRGVETYMYRNNLNWETYFAQLNGMFSNFVSGKNDSYFRALNSDKLTTAVTFTGYNMSKRVLNAYYYDANNELQKVQGPVEFTIEGLNFYKPIQIGNVSFQHFKYDAAAQVFVCSDESMQGATFTSGEKPNFYFDEAIFEHFFRGIYTDENYEEQFDQYILKSVPYNLQEAWNSIIAEIPDYYNTAFLPMNDGTGLDGQMIVSYYIALTYVEDNALKLGPAIKVPFAKSKTRPDEIYFSQLSFLDPSVVAGADFDTSKVSPEALQKFKDFFKTLFAQQTYIVIPTSDYKSFELGNVANGTYIQVDKW